MTGGAVGGGGDTTAKAKKRVVPNLVQQLGADYCLGGTTAEPKSGDTSPAVDWGVLVNLTSSSLNGLDILIPKILGTNSLIFLPTITS